MKTTNQKRKENLIVLIIVLVAISFCFASCSKYTLCEHNRSNKVIGYK